MLDELVDLDEKMLNALDMLIRQKERVAKTYNKEIKPKTFLANHLALKDILPMEKKDKVLRK